MLIYKVLNVTAKEVLLGTPSGKTMNYPVATFDFPVKKGMELEMYVSDTGKRYFVEHGNKDSNVVKSDSQPVRVVRTPRNMGLALFLTFIAGPIGLLYASVRDALVLILLNIVLGAFIFLMTLGSAAGRTAASLSSQSGAGGGGGIIGFLGFLMIFTPIASWIASMVLAYKDVKSYNRGGSGHTL